VYVWGEEAGGRERASSSVASRRERERKGAVRARAQEEQTGKREEKQRRASDALDLATQHRFPKQQLTVETNALKKASQLSWNALCCGPRNDHGLITRDLCSESTG